MKRYFLMMFLAFMFGNLMAQNNIVVRKAKVQKNTKMNEKRPSNKEVYPYRIPIKNVSCLMGNFSTQIESVTLCEEMTIITLTIKDSWNNNMVNSNKTAYIEDVETGKKYFIRSSDIGMGKSQARPHGNDWTFMETYPALPRTTKYINVFNGKVLSLKRFKLW